MKPTKGKVLECWETPVTVTLPAGVWCNLGTYVSHCHDTLGIKCSDEEMCIALHGAGSAVNSAFLDMRFETANKRGKK